MKLSWSRESHSNTGSSSQSWTTFNPVAKHFYAGFNRELLTRWLAIFHETLKSHLSEEQIRIWKLVSEKMGESLFMKNQVFSDEVNHRLQDHATMAPQKGKGI